MAELTVWLCAAGHGQADYDENAGGHVCSECAGDVRRVSFDLERLAELGNQLAEELDGLVTDSVIKAYLEQRHASITPLWMPSTGDVRPGVLDEWDELIGELQRRELVGPYGSDADVEELVQPDAQVRPASITIGSHIPPSCSRHGERFVEAGESYIVCLVCCEEAGVLTEAGEARLEELR